MKSPFASVLLAIVTSTFLSVSHAEEPKKSETSAPTEKLVFDTEWKGERITLPPEFALDMKWKGIEDIRFAPGMFDPKSDSFFSYAFVFTVSKDQEFTQEVIQKEMLVYYRGLSQTLLKARGKTVDTDAFTFELKKVETATDTPKGVAVEKATQYTGKLSWIEPFATAASQILHFEVQAWADPRTQRNYLFACVSPKTSDEPPAIWKELREIRKKFAVELEE